MFCKWIFLKTVVDRAECFPIVIVQVLSIGATKNIVQGDQEIEIFNPT